VYSLPYVVNKHLLVFKGQPVLTSDDEEYRCQLLEYIAFHAFESSKKGRAKENKNHLHGDNVRAKAAMNAREAGLCLLGVLNGSLTDGLIHWCDSPVCCNHYDRKVTIGKVVKGFLKVVFNKAPSSPEIGKWTKLGPSLDAIVLGFLTSGIASLAYPVAFSKGMQEKIVADSTGTGDDQFMLDMHWHTVYGKRARDALDLVCDEGTNLRLLVLALALEPIRIFVRFFLRFRASTPARTLDRSQACAPWRPSTSYQ